jgi:hypothetical protein
VDDYASVPAVTALDHSRDSAPPAAFVPGVLRDFVVVSIWDELLANPQLFVRYVESFGGEDDVTLLVYAPGRGESEVLEQVAPLVEASGLDARGTDVIVKAVPASDENAALVAETADALLSDAVAPPAFSRLPRFDADELDRLERLARLPKYVREKPNFLLLTLDSCRYDVLRDAHTPVLDSYVEMVPAQTPASYTYAAHQSFFAGILPNATESVPYYNRFTRQLLALMHTGELLHDKAYKVVSSAGNFVTGMREQGYQTVGAGAMNWFRQVALTGWFEKFAFTNTNAGAQVDFLVQEIDPRLPFFGFINFGETHDPFEYAGKTNRAPFAVQAREMSWPPRQEGPVGRDAAPYWHQVEAAEFLDRQLPRLFDALPPDTIVIVCGDHGEALGEDGYWGHGVNHPKVFEVPMGIFRLDGEPLFENVARASARSHRPAASVVQAAMSIEGRTSEAECELLFRHARDLGRGVIVEVGSSRGRSATALALGARAGGRGTPVYAIERHDVVTSALGDLDGPSDRIAFLRNTLGAGVADTVRPVNLSTEVVSPGWHEPVGLLWLDGDPGHEGVGRDLDGWLPHLVDGALVAFHDSTDPETGAYRLVEELLGSEGWELVERLGRSTVLRRSA